MYQTAGDRLQALRQEVKDLHHNYRTKEERQEAHQQLEAEMTALVWDSIEHDSPYSEEVRVDGGIAAIIIQTLQAVRDQVERELQRVDLYPNIRDQLFKRSRSLDHVIKLFYGTRPENRFADAPTRLLTVEYPDGSVDFAEALDDQEADELRESYLEDDGVVNTYVVAPQVMSDVTPHHPVLEVDNYYEELPAHTLRNVLAAAKGRLRLPEGFEPPEDIETVREYIWVDTE